LNPLSALYGGGTYQWDSSQIIAALTIGYINLFLSELYECFIIKERELLMIVFPEHEISMLLFVCAIRYVLLPRVNV